MRRVLNRLAIVIALASAGVWLVTGANRGWTKTSVPVTKQEPVTEIEYQEFEKRFHPGVDFLAAAWLGSAILAGASLLFRKTSTRIQT